MLQSIDICYHFWKLFVVYQLTIKMEQIWWYICILHKRASIWYINMSDYAVLYARNYQKLIMNRSLWKNTNSDFDGTCITKGTALRWPPRFFWTFRDPRTIKNRRDLVRRLRHVFLSKNRKKYHFFAFFEVFGEF